MGISKSKIEEIRQLRADGLGFQAIADELAVSKNTVKKYCNDVLSEEPVTGKQSQAFREKDRFEATKYRLQTKKLLNEEREKEGKRKAEKDKEEAERSHKEFLDYCKERKSAWLIKRASEGIEKLTNLIPDNVQTEIMSKVESDFKTYVKRDQELQGYCQEHISTLSPHWIDFSKEISDRLNVLASKFFEQVVKDLPEYKKFQREELLKAGIKHAEFLHPAITMNRNIGSEDKEALINDLRKTLKRELKNRSHLPSEDKVKEMADNYISNWIDHYGFNEDDF